MIPAAQAVRSLLAMKLIGTERQSHVMDLVVDQAIAVFAGIHVVPKTLLPDGLLFARRPPGLPAIEGGLAGTGRAGLEQAGLPRGPSFDLDFHSVPTNSSEEPLGA